MLANTIYVEPTYPAFGNDLLFEAADPSLNRDDQLRPFKRYRQEVDGQGLEIHTSDLFDRSVSGSRALFYSLGSLRRIKELTTRAEMFPVAFVCMEPPVVAPSMYQALPQLTALFERVFVYNTTGDGYSLTGVDVNKLAKFYCPSAYDHVLEPFWSKKDRLIRAVVINGNLRPRSRINELYSVRIDAMTTLAESGAVDLFGHGWKKVLSRAGLWYPVWSNYPTISRIYRGPTPSKLETLSRYRFCLCFENMKMSGYITEKIFDCFYAGTIPLYLGAPDVEAYIPSNAYIDCRAFSSWKEMWAYAVALGESQINDIRQAGRAFLASEAAYKFYNSLHDVFRHPKNWPQVN
jgi:alpha(1,3/1,4) fucosyltransferase